jgi:hypothetical protein
MRDDLRVALREVGKKIFILCTPWPSWTVSGCWITDTPAAGNITATDAAGREVLSFVPLPLVVDFLSEPGQTLVSDPGPHCIFSVLIHNLNDPQTFEGMASTRSSSINRLRNNGSMIFGPGFDQTWFPLKFNRGSIPKLQELLSAHMTPEGKKYHLLPRFSSPTGPRARSQTYS